MKRSMLVATCLLFAGCLQDESVSTTEQELAAWGSFVLNCGGAPSCESDIGTAIDRTCFLGGISGPIATDTEWTDGTGVFRDFDRYVLRIGNTNATHGTVIATCISGATDRVEAQWRQRRYPAIAQVVPQILVQHREGQRHQQQQAQRAHLVVQQGKSCTQAGQQPRQDALPGSADIIVFQARPQHQRDQHGGQHEQIVHRLSERMMGHAEFQRGHDAAAALPLAAQRRPS